MTTLICINHRKSISTLSQICIINDRGFQYTGEGLHVTPGGGSFKDHAPTGLIMKEMFENSIPATTPSLLYLSGAVQNLDLPSPPPPFHPCEQSHRRDWSVQRVTVHRRLSHRLSSPPYPAAGSASGWSENNGRDRKFNFIVSFETTH